jgi:hypothetical protein
MKGSSSGDPATAPGLEERIHKALREPGPRGGWRALSATPITLQVRGGRARHRGVATDAQSLGPTGKSRQAGSPRSAT